MKKEEKMIIKVDNITLDVGNNGYPYWFHIEERGQGSVSFTSEQAPAICDALKNLIEFQKRVEEKIS